jgi:hypothetical protein
MAKHNRLKLFMVILIGWVVYFIPSRAFTQDVVPDSLTEIQKQAVRIYIDCDDCDQDYTRKTVTFVNYVRDPADAQVHILVTSQKSANGGTEYTMTFIGKENFAGINDTLVYRSNKSDVKDVIRKGLCEKMKLGLVRYASHTPVMDQISISHTAPEVKGKVVDKWNNWLFSISGNGIFNGEHSYRMNNAYWSISANHITADIKLNFVLSGSYSDNWYDYGTVDYTSISRSQDFTAKAIFSIDDHWSWGIFGTGWTSTFSNIDLGTSVSPGIEYNIYPYNESTRRLLRIDYKPSVSYNNYTEKTIYNKMDQVLFSEDLSLTLDQKEPWGSASITLSGSHYIHDVKKYNVGINGSVSIRIIEGLSATWYASYYRQRDQLALPLRGATAEEVLLQKKQLESQYSYFATIGLSYSFGAIYNNIVNPRFGSSGSGGYSISISSE